ncbi:MAG: hypothetical protein ACRC9L_09930 [Brevinema sp.]
MKSLFWKSLFLLLPVLLFSQILEHQTDLSGHAGLQLAEFEAAGKGSRLNELYYFNPILFYRSKYLIKDDEILGYIRGRVSKEEPLSSVTLRQLNEIRSPTLQVSNLIQIYPQYQDIANNYELFLRIFEESLQIALEEQQSGQGNANGYAPEYDPAYDSEYDEAYYPAEGDAAAGEYVPGTTPIDPQQDYQSVDNLNNLTFLALNMRAQDMMSNLDIPSLEQALQDTSKSFEEKELEFIVRYEQLNRAYSNTVAEYYKVLEARNLIEKSFYFNPADDTETFRVFLHGLDDPSAFWSKSFTLDGKANYQSYDDTVWFLGYEVPLTKADVRALVAVVMRNKKVGLKVAGRGGEISFDLSDRQFGAIKQLFSDFALGKMVVPGGTSAVESSPLLQ